MSKEYDNYLDEHIGAVHKAADWMFRNLNVFDGMTDEEAWAFRNAVTYHDRSKYSSEEYDAYDAYFYGEKDEDAFNYAWLHHIHNNPHHWQHWLLMNDDGKYRDPDKVIPLEMPKVCVLEMVADWWSFSWRTGNLEEVFGWYEGHKDDIILHPKTREFVEAVLGEIWGRLPARVSE
jgi:hypothetical protein